MIIDKRFIVFGAAVASIGYANFFYMLVASSSCNHESKALRSSTAKPSRPVKESVAVLISGQCHRFIYRDQPGPLFTFSQTSAKPKIDVYIALQCGRKINPLFGDNDTPPYMEKLNITDIRHWYLEKGASNVTVKVIGIETLNQMVDEITAQTTTVYNTKDGFDLADMVHWHGRWGIEVRKFYLRNFAFLKAQKTQMYSGYVYWREDNYFFLPLDLDETLFSMNVTTQDQPFVIVDKGCEFASYSDKMYVANHAGAAILFGSTYAEFIERMKRFVLFAMYRKNCSSEMWQPEAFVHDSLSTAVVERAELSRMDVRYNEGKRCIPTAYYHCMPEETKTMAREHDLAVCW